MEEAMEMESETSGTKNQIKNYNAYFYATMCHVCKKFSDSVRLQRCSGCKMISYCGQQHQKEHWKQHKHLCKAIQDVARNIRKDELFFKDLDSLKLNFITLVSCKLQRKLETYEQQMINFPRECTVCHEQNGQLLEDCQKCAVVSFCKNHKDDIKHKDICATLELSFHSDFLAMRNRNDYLDFNYFQRVSNTDTFQDMNDFIKTYVNIPSHSEMLYNIWAAQHSQYLTRPLTLFHVMRLLNYVPVGNTLVIHVLAANIREEVSLKAWEVLLHLEPITSLVIILIGSTMKPKSVSIPIFDNCTLQKKKWSFEFYNGLYENYARSPSFLKPDLVVGFNVYIAMDEPTSVEKISASSIQVLVEQNCPFVLTCLIRKIFEDSIVRINTMLNRPDYFYSGKNPFASLRPSRVLIPEQVFYVNQYIIVYRSLCHN